MAREYKHKIGDLVTIINQFHGHEFRLGETVRIVALDDDGAYAYKAEDLTGYEQWFLSEDEIEAEDEVVLRASDLVKATLDGDFVRVGAYCWARMDAHVDMPYALALISADRAFKANPILTLAEKLALVIGDLTPSEAAEAVLANYDVTPKS